MNGTTKTVLGLLSIVAVLLLAALGYTASTKADVNCVKQEHGERLMGVETRCTHLEVQYKSIDDKLEVIRQNTKKE